MCVGCALLGFAAGRLVRSPAQVAAETAPPAPSILTATVERRIVSEAVAFDGTIVRELQATIGPPLLGDASKAIVTGLPFAVGDRIQDGDVVAEVSGTPVFALSGVVPSYRTLLPGEAGPDIEQLQSSLRDLDYYAGGDTPGFFGKSTGLAISQLYRDQGYTPEQVGQEAVDAADDAVLAAQQSLQSAGQGEKAGLQAQVAKAKEQLAKAQASAGPTVPLGSFAFVAELPATVTAVSSALGGEASESLITLASGDLVVRAEASGPDAEALAPGQTARVLPAAGGRLSGRVARIEVSTAAEQVDGAQAQAPAVFIVQAHRPSRLRAAGAGSPVRVVIDLDATPGEVLAVPSSAIYGRSDGTNFVTQLDAEGRRQSVDVVVGKSGSGWVEVHPSDPLAEIAPGDSVVVGSTTQVPSR